jgi:hypothetical protein
MNNLTKQPYFSKLLGLGDFSLKPETLNSKQKISFWSLVLVTVVVKVVLIPYNMMDMGDSATRVWNALWWAQQPFFVLPVSGHPFWFYLMGPILMVTKEIFYTPIITMIVLMTLAGYYIFKTTLLLSDFKTAMFAFVIFILNPAIFRLNFEPYSQQPYLTAACIMVYYFIKAIGSAESKKYFILSGIFSFFALFSRPEAIFVIAPMCLVAFLSRKNGCCHFIFLSLFFQVFWLILSQVLYNNPFQTFSGADQYTVPVNIQGMALGLRMKGLFLPYYFLVVGLTIFIFWYFIKGVIYSYKNYPKIFLIVLFIPMFMPALIDGLAGAKSTTYHTTQYIYMMFFISPIFAGIGLGKALDKFKSSAAGYSFAAVVILTCIPLSYIKEYVPVKYNKMFPKVVEFIVTSEDTQDAKVLIDFIDKNIKQYPALIFDVEGNVSSIFYVPFRTKLPATPAINSAILISGYNIPSGIDSMKISISDFMKKNKSGIIMVHKSGTLMSQIFAELTSNKPYIRNDFQKAGETDKWIIYLYK